MKNVLSIQSHVIYGHAGNSAAVFPMQRLGVNVWPLNTVQLSNHMQYGHWAGSAIDAAKMEQLVDGIAAIGALKRCDAVLSGFLGSPAQARAAIDIVRTVKATNPNAWYFCDPAMGQTGGIRPEPGVEELIVAELPELADGMAPNHSELQKLAGRRIETVPEAIEACRAIIRRGPKLILVKHLHDRNSPADRFNMLVVTETEAWIGQRPLYAFPRHPVGVGDLTSAVFVARRLRGDSVRAAFEHTLAAVHAVVKATYDARRYELELVAAQDEIARPSEWFGAWLTGAD
ncbi:pyridoxal kinase PdxY [Burkholderia sp. TSV86]|uniref:pyridoxal kinase PdxY n=1 Tax=Burkholderia sp. TSV86 TaxID=1385594 RepID=UPI00075C74B7|nr:pyridoxal kinase PdxY [Burkholderia sp. TSV86]KVE34112.1 pyridoxamine kinase [Burkholderia sp. TSV86]